MRATRRNWVPTKGLRGARDIVLDPGVLLLLLVIALAIVTFWCG